MLVGVVISFQHAVRSFAKHVTVLSLVQLLLEIILADEGGCNGLVTHTELVDLRGQSLLEWKILIHYWSEHFR